MNQSFEKYSKYFFWVAGVATMSAPLIIMLFPVSGLKLIFGLTYFEQSPQLFPIIGHWGMMVAGIGALLFLSATNKAIRKTTVIFATIEKAYIVFIAIYCIVTKQIFAANYYLVFVADSLMAIGGLWYLFQSKKLDQL